MSDVSFIENSVRNTVLRQGSSGSQEVTKEQADNERKSEQKSVFIKKWEYLTSKPAKNITREALKKQQEEDQKKEQEIKP